MIPNFPDVEKIISIGKMIEFLQNGGSNWDMTDYQFYLTGSRFFGWANLNSDWDFFVKSDDDSLTRVLYAVGFVENKEVGERDKLIVSSWIHRNPNFHIMLVSNVELKLKAQEKFKGQNRIPTGAHDWDFMYKLLETSNAAL